VRNLERSLAEWHSLRETADLDENHRVTLGEFLRFADVFLADRDAVRAYARGDVQLLFDAMDLDGDGRISADEYRDYLRVCGADTRGADAFFAHADLDENGRITRDEMTHAMEEFLTSTDPASAGNRLFGPLDDD
jgi:Ca2+-binding EF-hand superfamily protein